jgi:two-component system chemotaxis sensor kinase CheA
LLPCIILSVGGERLGLFVDALLDEQEVVLKPHSRILKRVRNVSGATILETGEVCMVLNPQDLMKTARKRTALVASERATTEGEKKRLILLMEDSILIRTLEQRILESAGYEVVTAVDGVDALDKLKTRAFDAVVSDVHTPRMDGLTLTAMIRQDKHYQDLPIILVTALATEEDKRKGMEVGANAYLTKPAFDQKVLLDTLRRLV